MSVKAELESLCKPKKGEDRTKYINRLVKAIQDIDDDEWEQMSEETQEWANAASKAQNEGGPVIDFLDKEGNEVKKKSSRVKATAAPAPKRKADDDDDDEDENGEDEDEDEDEDEEEEERPAAKKKKVVAKAKPKSKAKDEDEDEDDEPEEEDEDEEPKPKKKAPVAVDKKAPVAAKKAVGAATLIKQLILARPNITTDQILDKLQKKGHTASRMTVATVRSGMRDTLRVIKAAGKLDESVDI